MNTSPLHVLLLRFPYRVSRGGGERYTMTVVRGTRHHDVLWAYRGTDTVLLQSFREESLDAKRAWGGVEPVSKWALMLFPFFALWVFPRLCFLLLSFKMHQGNVVVMMSLGEKILATPIARLVGLHVIWVEHVAPKRWLSLNPYKPFYVLFSRVVRIVVLSEHMKKEYQNLGVHEKNIAVIPYGLPAQNHKKREIPAEIIKQSKPVFTIGTVSRLEKEKGIEFLIQAIKELLPIIPDIRLIIVGSGSQQAALRYLTENLGLQHYVQFVPYQKNIQPWYSLFDVFVLPSAKRESFGMTLLEAQRAGRPVIGSNLGGIPEIIEHGVTGYLAQPGSGKDLADKILLVYNDPEKTLRMIRAAKLRVDTLFSEDKMIASWNTLLRQHHL